MSASLVGSEMCIRDSPCCSGGGTWRRRGSLAPSWGCAPAQCPRRCTVSYTHLTLPTICSV
eukprot:8707150-Alexandrium_andersonii.AAC.1